MLQSVEEVYEEIGMEKGMEKGQKDKQNEIAIKMLRAGWLKKEQIAEFTGLDKIEIEQLENELNSGHAA